MLQHGNRIRQERGNDYVSELEAVESSTYGGIGKRSARSRSPHSGKQHNARATKGKHHD